ncbi:hypothetical protein [Sorangium sp. So ce1389]|uniref:hypothetical protein n=1 Tax=Sorangium sp. So ce1389 TaxID=3133336 RepID=UPI003F648BF5
MSDSYRSVVACCVAILGLTGCVAPQVKQAEVPYVPLSADEAAREAIYEKYKLTADIGGFTALWKRSDGNYSFAALETLSKEYPETDEVYGSVKTRATWLTVPAAVGGATLGATLGYNLSAPESQRMSSDTQIVMYSIGGGLTLLALILPFVTHDPAEDFADVYNAALRRDLDLPAAASTGTEAASAWLPRPAGQGVGWVF